MIEISGEFFDPVKIMESGQCFRWQKNVNGSISVISRGKYLEMKASENKVILSCSESDFEDYWAEYLDMGTDYEKIANLILKSGDAHLIDAYNLGRGIRILKQDLWEVIISFLISQNNNITRISKSIEAICQKAGLKEEGGRGYRFPGPMEVDYHMFDDSSLGLGYRVPYLMEMYKFAARNPNWLDELKTLNYEAAMDALIARPGIGPKVANCVCLFGLHHVDAFPVDTHVKQLINKYYPSGFDFEYFNGVAGIIQQFLFFYELKGR